MINNALRIGLPRAAAIAAAVLCRGSTRTTVASSRFRTLSDRLMASRPDGWHSPPAPVRLSEHVDENVKGDAGHYREAQACEEAENVDAHAPGFGRHRHRRHGPARRKQG